MEARWGCSHEVRSSGRGTRTRTVGGVNRPTGYSVGEEGKAARFLATLSELSSRARRRETSAIAQDASLANDPLRTTVAQYVERWLEERKELGLTSWSDDAARMRLHVVPIIGQITLAEVSPRHMKQLVTHHRKAGRLRAKRSNSKVDPWYFITTRRIDRVGWRTVPPPGPIKVRTCDLERALRGPDPAAWRPCAGSLSARRCRRYAATTLAPTSS